MSAAAARRLLLALGLLLAALAGAQAPVPPLTAHVTDLTATLGPQQVAALEQRLADLERRKGAQLAVLVVRTTGPEPMAQYALRVAEQWQLGRRGVDDAALLVVATQDRTLRIEVGRGLEGALNDATARRIIDEAIAPHLREQDLAGGIAAGVERMVRVVDGEALPPPPAGRDAGEGLPGGLTGLVLAALLIGLVLRAVFGRVAGSLATGGVVGLAAWWLAGPLSFALLAGGLALLVSLLGERGLWLLRGGGGGGGRGRDGGLHGGGGGFGGGGASGRW